MSALLALAWRGFARNLRRYRALIAALVIAVSMLILLLGSALGMREAIRAKARRYFGGDLIVTGLRGHGDERVDAAGAADAVLSAVRAAGSVGAVTAVAPRAIYWESADIQLFHAGYYVRQERINGVDWEQEADILAQKELVAGGVPGEVLRGAGGAGAVLIEAMTAELLNATVGDEITVSIRSLRGRTNTATLRVAGIFNEPNYLGLGMYMERSTLAELRESDEEALDEVGLYLGSPARDSARVAQAVIDRLEAAGLPVAGVFTDRATYQSAAREARAERAYAVVALDVRLDEINEVIRAITIIAFAVVLLFVVIVAVGVGNTYRMIVYERTREIGTMRALGMQRRRTVALFLIEALYIGVIGTILGGAGGFALLHGVRGWLRIEDQEVASLFLVQSRLAWELPAGALAGVAALTIAAGVAGCVRTALRAGRVHPVEAMRQD